LAYCLVAGNIDAQIVDQVLGDGAVGRRGFSMENVAAVAEHFLRWPTVNSFAFGVGRRNRRGFPGIDRILAFARRAGALEVVRPPKGRWMPATYYD